MEAEEFDRAVNPERDQDRAQDLLADWLKYGHIMFHQQRAIYWQLAQCLAGRTVLEAGCGAGVGTAVLERRVRNIVGSDKLPGNVAFAKALYPWIEFGVWDIAREPSHWLRNKVEVVVAVEVLEHVADQLAALRNLLDAAIEEVWLSTPNGIGKPAPPENPYHAYEYTPRDMLVMFNQLGIPESSGRIEILDWEGFKPQSIMATANPLVYRIRKT